MFIEATCCKDLASCCPHNKKCNLKKKMCEKTELNSDVEKRKYYILIYNNNAGLKTVCLDNNKCQINDTCCLIEGGRYGCCPFASVSEIIIINCNFFLIYNFHIDNICRIYLFMKHVQNTLL